MKKKYNLKVKKWENENEQLWFSEKGIIYNFVNSHTNYKIKILKNKTTLEKTQEKEPFLNVVSKIIEGENKGVLMSTCFSIFSTETIEMWEKMTKKNLFNCFIESKNKIDCLLKIKKELNDSILKIKPFIHSNFDKKHIHYFGIKIEEEKNKERIYESEEDTYS